MFEAIISMLGIAAAALYVGYLAYKIESVPLSIIVVATFVLAIREFIVDLRQARRETGKPGAG